MIIIDKETFEAEVQQSSMPCVVDPGARVRPAFCPDARSGKASPKPMTASSNSASSMAETAGSSSARHGRTDHPFL